MNNIVSVSEGKIAFYAIRDTKVYVDVIYKEETFWMTQKAIAELFDAERSVVTKHIGKVYDEEELERGATCAKNALVQKKDTREVSRTSEFCSLNMIIAVGYRVNSNKATRFRQWATANDQVSDRCGKAGGQRR
jgi:hypothetical protein